MIITKQKIYLYIVIYIYIYITEIKEKEDEEELVLIYETTLINFLVTFFTRQQISIYYIQYNVALDLLFDTLTN